MHCFGEALPRLTRRELCGASGSMLRQMCGRRTSSMSSWSIGRRSRRRGFGRCRREICGGYAVRYGNAGAPSPHPSPLRGEGGACGADVAELHPTAACLFALMKLIPTSGRTRVSKDAFRAALFSVAMVQDAGLRPAPHHEGSDWIWRANIQSAKPCTPSTAPAQPRLRHQRRRRRAPGRRRRAGRPPRRPRARRRRATDPPAH